LVDSHLLRAEPSLRGGYTYELSHDTLVAPILKAKTERMEEERQLREAELRKQREAELAEERRKRRRTTLFAIGASILAVIAIVAAVFAFQQTAYANEQAQLAKDNEEIALKRKQEAQDALDRFLEEDRKRRALEVRKLMEDVEYFNKAGFDDALQITLDSILKIDTTAAMRMRIDSLREALE
jgi:uncharacterized protein HemX